MADAGKAEDVEFNLERIYVKDISYESPAAPQVFLEQAAPQLDIHLGVKHAPIQAEQGEKNIFLVEVQQAGLFRVAGIADEMLQRALEVSGAYVLLPFVREVVGDLVGKGGFPQLLINPINFEALYDQKQAMLQKSAG